MSKELLLIETDEVTISLKGKIPTSVENKFSSSVVMHYKTQGANADTSFYNPTSGELEQYEGQSLPPIFFENGIYEVVIIAKNNEQFSFMHEYDAFQNAITKMSRVNILTGTLNFTNEIGLSEFNILKNNKHYLTFTIEIFPLKLDYQEDYIALLEEVNEEVYNLAYSFIKKTFMNASLKQFKDPTLAEFYRIIEVHINDYLKAIKQVEHLPHHQLVTTYEKVKGEKLRKQDSVGRSYLRKNAGQFVDVQNGIQIGQRKIMPKSGMQLKKTQTFDTHENRYVKWSMNRIVAKLSQLIDKIERNNKVRDEEYKNETLTRIKKWKQQIGMHLNKPFWREIGALDRSVYSLVMQMGIGYREVYKIFTMLSQSLVLHGELYKLSVKDIATLYEYWSYLKLGQILSRKCEQVSQDIVQVNSNGLFINLSSNNAASRVFKHPYTDEQIILTYQYHSGKNSQTVQQKPDTMLSIAKQGKEHAFQYIFDAKYRLNLEGEVGPLNDDINVMHRYRDAIVGEQMNLYERLTFGAYVLFPWKNDEAYREHPLYLSINKVNIGGLPFLPNNIAYVTEIIDNLLNKSGEQLQKEGILPKGSVQYLKPVDGDVLILNGISNTSVIQVPREYVRDIDSLSYIGFADYRGVRSLAKIQFHDSNENGFAVYLNEPEPYFIAHADYHAINENVTIPFENLQYANNIEEALLPIQLIKVLNRFTFNKVIQLNKPVIDPYSVVERIEMAGLTFSLNDGKLWCTNTMVAIDLNLDENELFKWISEKISENQ